MSQDTAASEEKTFISPPHSPTQMSESPSESPQSSPSLSQTTSTPKKKKRSSMEFTSPQARRRGYVRPQGTEFAKSARSRNSVMALGSIAHVQYFFARTGLLDGKGGRSKTKKKDDTGFEGLTRADFDNALIDSTYSSLRSSPEPGARGTSGKFIADPNEYTTSPLEDVPDDGFDMLPPTVSTYKHSAPEVLPPPDRETLREELSVALDDCRRIWSEAANLEFGKMSPSKESKPRNKDTPEDEGTNIDDESDEEEETSSTSMQQSGPSFKDVLLHTLLESSTVAVRAAKEYYYATDLTMISSIVSEKKLRDEFMVVLDVLKRISTRNDVKAGEKETVMGWVDRVEKLLENEERLQDEGRRAGQVWLEGDWEGREWERYHHFLTYFDAYTGSAATTALPEHDSSNPVESPLLKIFQTGHRLILLHNAIVRRSRRPFGQIPSFHTDFNKPYRMAENLRYWIKAAEIRWEVKLDMDVMGAVQGTESGMKSFESAVAQWCEKLLLDVKREWKEDHDATGHEKKERRRSRRMDTDPATKA